MASCLAARTAKSRSNEPPPCFAWGDPLSAIAPSRTLTPQGLRSFVRCVFSTRNLSIYLSIYPPPSLLLTC